MAAKIILMFKRSLLTSVAVLLASIGGLPMLAAADTPTCTPPDVSTGVHRPVGADAGTYSYNCDTGLWENAHYTFDPATTQVTAKDPVAYTYNAATGQYDSTTWVFNAPSGNYVAVTQSVSQPPAGATVIGGPPAPQTSSIDGTGPGSNNTIDNNGSTGDTNSISNTGPDSNNTIGGSNSGTLDSNALTNASINNLLNQVAGTGNSIVIGNTTAGNATSGNAQDIANAINLLQSSSSALSGNAVTFVANINGDVNGDFLIDPASLGTIQPSTASPTSGNNNLKINNTTNAAINNTINLAANSGNAAVANNTSGGNATSGSAEAIANVVNVIDSAINSGSSFVGVININGNFNGNILVPPNLIDQLIASNVPTVTISNTGSNSNNAINNNNSSNNTTVTNTNNEGITNHVNAGAASGQATVANNTSAGSATSGSAATNITAFNLTGSSIIGANDLLVFVNVLGTWVGMIVNAPPGATAAELGGGITSNTQNGNNNTTVNNNANEQINNTINAKAQSGDASVTSNTKGGNATSGNADTAVNLLNVENSSLSLSNWFGILFINVFGSWNGNFGFSPAATNAGNTGDQAGGSPTSTGGVPATIRAFRFAPHSSGNNSSSNNGNSFFTASAVTTTGTGSGAVLASHVAKAANKASDPAAQTPGGHGNLLLPLTGIVLFVLYAAGDGIYSRNHPRVPHP